MCLFGEPILDWWFASWSKHRCTKMTFWDLNAEIVHRLKFEEAKIGVGRIHTHTLTPHAWTIHKANSFNCYYILCDIGISPNCWSLCIRCCCSGTQDGLHYIRIPESWMFWKLRCYLPNLYFHCQEVSTHASQDADSYGSRVCRLRSRRQLFLGMKGECKGTPYQKRCF